MLKLFDGMIGYLLMLCDPVTCIHFTAPYVANCGFFYGIAKEELGDIIPQYILLDFAALFPVYSEIVDSL